MINPDFYPTPKDLVNRMLAPYRDSLMGMLILEPSAGKGDIADVIADSIEDRRSYRSGHGKNNIHTIELEPDLQATLRGKGYRVIGDDFLQFTGGNLFYDLIVMNPPFSKGVEHVLHAWDILRRGDLCTILPREVLTNPYCESRKLLVKLIHDNGGTVEEAGSAFEDAERKTSVEVVIIRIHKDTTSDLDGMFSKTRFKSSTIDTDSPEMQSNPLAKRDVVASLSDAYQATLNSFQAAFKSLYDLSVFGSQFGNNMGMVDYSGDKHRRTVKEAFCQSMEKVSLTDLADGKALKEAYISAFNGFSGELRRAAWETVFNRTQMERFMTKQVRGEFEKFQKDQSCVEFTPANIGKLLDTLFLNTNKIGESAITEAFDLMTKYHKENRVHIEGWVTNDAWRVNNKVILPDVIDWSFRTPHVRYQRGNELNDIDRGLCFLTGKSFDNIRKLTESIDAAGKNAIASGESEFFTFKFFKKGTIHITFKDQNTWESFNIAACRGKNWLPGA